MVVVEVQGSYQPHGVPTNTYADVVFERRAPCRWHIRPLGNHRFSLRMEQHKHLPEQHTCQNYDETPLEEIDEPALCASP